MRDADGEARQKLAKAGRILAAAGQGEWTRGHVSIRCPGDAGRFYMKPKEVGLGEITVDALIVCDLAGEKVEGAGKRHSEVHIHASLYRARPEINAVIHAHPMSAVVFSALGKPLQAIGLPGAVFADGLPIFSRSNLLINTRELGKAMAEVMGSHNALILQNHGIVAAGRSMDEAIYLAMALDSACQMQLMVEAAGGANALGKSEEVEALRKHMLRDTMFRRTFDYLAREAGAEER